MKTMRSLACVAALLIGAQEASAQDERWTPWLGCWERVTERLDATSADGEARGNLEPDALPDGTAPQVCVERAGDDGVRLTTTVPGQERIEETLVADGEAHQISDAGCQGTETVEWSSNGLRLFASADVACAGGTSRTISGLALMTPDNTWLDIRSVRIGDIANTRVSRYRRIDAEPSRRIPRSGSPPLSLEELKEASGKVTDAVLEAALVETNPRLPVRSGTLIELSEAGVSPAVLDLVVALAHPDRFVVERTGQISTVTGSGTIDSYRYSGFYQPAYYYSPFGYSYIGYYDPFLFRTPYYGFPRRGGFPPVDVPVNPSGRARAVQGEGYTRIRPAGEVQAQPRVARPRPGGAPSTRSVSGTSGTVSSSGSSSSGGGSSGGGSSSGGSSSGGSSSGGSSSGSGASPQGYSGGGGGGRTAQPR